MMFDRLPNIRWWLYFAFVAAPLLVVAAAVIVWLLLERP